MSCPTPRRTPVESSVLTSIAYALDATLEIEFRTGDLPVRRRPTGRLPGLTAAESKGAYFNRYVRTRFPYQRLV